MIYETNDVKIERIQSRYKFSYRSYFVKPIPACFFCWIRDFLGAKIFFQWDRSITAGNIRHWFIEYAFEHKFS